MAANHRSGMDPQLAIDNVCAWPNIKRYPDGDIVALLFNQPCHAKWEGDVDCWGSRDDGRTWEYRGTPVVHLPGTNRMNHAAGFARDGAIIAIVSGWTNRPKPGEPDRPFKDARTLEPAVCRSVDRGRSWQRAGSVASLPQRLNPIPYGDVHRCADGSLLVPFYGPRYDDTGAPEGRSACFICRSTDDGRTWTDPSLIADEHTETTVLPVTDKRWLAAARSDDPGNEQRLDLFVSEDAGRTWKFQQPITGPWQHPGHLLRLADGRILLTHGVRVYGIWGSIAARLSDDEGRTWKKSALLTRPPAGANDGGYPSSLQLPDGHIVTAFYTGLPGARYYMSVIRWELNEVMKTSWSL